MHTSRYNSKSENKVAGTGHGTQMEAISRRIKPDDSSLEYCGTSETSGGLRCFCTNANSIMNKNGKIVSVF